MSKSIQNINENVKICQKWSNWLKTLAKMSKIYLKWPKLIEKVIDFPKKL